MTIVILMMVIEVDIFNSFIFFIKNDRSTFSHFVFCIVRIIILSSFQRWQASLAYSLPALPSFCLSLLHSGVCGGVVCLCKWPSCCLWRFCVFSVFLFLIFLIPNLVLVRLLTLYHSTILRWQGMWCSSFLSFFSCTNFFHFPAPTMAWLVQLLTPKRTWTSGMWVCFSFFKGSRKKNTDI